MDKFNEDPRLLTYATQRARVLYSELPKQEVVDGGRVDWGASGNKDRAVYVAALLGHVFDPKCNSCNSDLYMVIKNAARK